MILSLNADHDWTCGPVVVRDLLVFYDRPAPREADLADAMGTNTKSGTHPERIVKWLERNGFHVRWGEGGTLDTIRKSLDQHHPVIVLGIQWGGHYMLAIGEERDRHRLIFADPAAADEGRSDGFTKVYDKRFEDEWFDVAFGTKKLYIIAVPK